MKKMFSVQNTSDTTNIALLIARLGIAVLMLTHGVPKMIMLFSEDPIKFPPVLGMSGPLSLSLAVFAEVFCSIFILAGFATRLAVIPLIVTMLVAALFIHSTDPLAVKEPAMLYLLAYLVLLFAGSGKYSVDNLLQYHNRERSYGSAKVKSQSVSVYQ